MRILVGLFLLALAGCGGAPHYTVYPLYPQYVGEEHGGGATGDTIVYLDEAARARLKVQVIDGLLCDVDGKPLDPDVDHHPEHTGGALYVMDGQGDFYVSFAAQVGKFHHSSLVAGAPVAGAGDFTVLQGKLYEVNNSSGHYRPPPEALDQVVLRLRELGVDLSEVKVSYWGQKDRRPPPPPP